MTDPHAERAKLIERLERLWLDIESYTEEERSRDSREPHPDDEYSYSIKFSDWQAVQEAADALSLLPAPLGVSEGMVGLLFKTGTPPVKRGGIEMFVVATRSEKGREATICGYYLNAFPLEHYDCICASESEHTEDGCPVTGWFYDESNFEYDNCYHAIKAEIFGWAEMPSGASVRAALQAAIAASGGEKGTKPDIT